MALLPETTTDELDDLTAIEDEAINTTYYLDLANKRIIGRVDGAKAIYQAIIKILSTERAAHVIYDDGYGIELEDLIGQRREYVLAVLEERIKDALTADERILDITDYHAEPVKADTINVSFFVTTVAGGLSVNNAEVKIA